MLVQLAQEKIMLDRTKVQLSPTSHFQHQPVRCFREFHIQDLKARQFKHPFPMQIPTIYFFRGKLLYCIIASNRHHVEKRLFAPPAIAILHMSEKAATEVVVRRKGDFCSVHCHCHLQLSPAVSITWASHQKTTESSNGSAWYRKWQFLLTAASVEACLPIGEALEVAETSGMGAEPCIINLHFATFDAFYWLTHHAGDPGWGGSGGGGTDAEFVQGHSCLLKSFMTV